MTETKKTKNNKYSLREPGFYNIWRRICIFLITGVGYQIFFRLIYRLEIHGKENIPKDANYIVAANHLSNLDPPLMAGIMPRGVAYMSKKELFNNFFLRWWLDWMGAFAVDREKLGVSTIKTVKSLKSTGWVLGIFPQGTRQEPGEISNVNKGFASLAKITNCGILPIGITGTNEKHRMPFSGKIVVNIGKVIPSTDNPDEMVNKWGKAVAKLTGFTYKPHE